MIGHFDGAKLAPRIHRSEILIIEVKQTKRFHANDAQQRGGVDLNNRSRLAWRWRRWCTTSAVKLHLGISRVAIVVRNTRGNRGRPSYQVSISRGFVHKQVTLVEQSGNHVLIGSSALYQINAFHHDFLINLCSIKAPEKPSGAANRDRGIRTIKSEMQIIRQVARIRANPTFALQQTR